MEGIQHDKIRKQDMPVLMPDNPQQAVCHQGNSREASGQEVPGIDCDGAVVGMGSVGIIGIVPVGDDLALSAVPLCCAV